jgi:hypothetical protein
MAATTVARIRQLLAADGAWLANPAHRACFAEPALNSLAVGHSPTSWEVYWHGRGWADVAARALGEDAAVRAPFFRQLSGMLSFPLTLAHALARHQTIGYVAPCAARELNLVVLGARAEASLPPAAWLELAAVLPAQRLHLQMVGPSVESTLQEYASREAWRAGPLRVTLHRGLFHELLARERDAAHGLGAADGFVLFHPGLAHQGWQRAWEPSMCAVLASRVPALCTGFGVHDSASNARFVARLQGEERSGGGADSEVRRRQRHRIWCNPFASRRLLLDEGAGGGGSAELPVIQSNHSFFVVNSRRTGRRSYDRS